ncbi:MAG: TIGR04084 family radical SAM/SPASM domain-containing protein [Promethearchaeota archaeon]
MNYHLILTQRCNLQCRYCGGSTDLNENPRDITYSLEILKNFLVTDPDPTIAFYGGEPLMKIEQMKQIMDIIPARRFILQTNGILLDKVDKDYLHRFDEIVISIDGPRFITDIYRGEGTYDWILENLSYVRDLDYKGDIIARMTISTHSDIYRDVTHLLRLQNPHFDHIHWQLDVLWNDRSQWVDLKGWIRKSYNPGIRRLIDDWLLEMEKHEKVPGIVPFLGIIKDLLKNQKTRLRCGSGLNFFAINTNGTISACPICPELESFIVGSIYDNSPKDIENSLLIDEPCLQCDIYEICGGRCLFMNQFQAWNWNEDDYKLICETVHYLINELYRIRPKVKALIKQKRLSYDQLAYPMELNCCEIIP